jgi:hypothetical protein
MVDVTTQQFEKAASELDAKDKKFVSKTEGGVPQTKAEEIIANNGACSRGFSSTFSIIR